jgi:hypothetical protein
MKCLILVGCLLFATQAHAATHQGMHTALAVIDVQLAVAGVDASFGETLFAGPYPFCPFPCQYGIDNYEACRFADPEMGCDWCEEWAKGSCRYAYHEEICDWTIIAFNKCIDCVELSRFFDETCIE